ncbi:hypothetical protein FZC78_10300 [Rossellomorea vietnamensis]|uniref:Uncharacterized protein n=1 Tax=Rossellomorea vietnamensis TaxID=218284 RepID=A0A5D4NRP4_9BACI|nr:hypothetical protein [Rossellomorea vietnamensis]TYS17013.1 hypothetical protein FZC78_10300 [Rossellomorea vietnamensis]
MSEYEGDNIVKTYSKKFRLNLKNSMKELTSFGFTISSEERAEIKRLIGIQKQQRENKKRKKEARELRNLIESDEAFAFVAGYPRAALLLALHMRRCKRSRTRKNKCKQKDTAPTERYPFVIFIRLFS